MDDTVLFLSAYNSTQYKATNWFLRKLRNVIPHKKKQMQAWLEDRTAGAGRSVAGDGRTAAR